MRYLQGGHALEKVWDLIEALQKRDRADDAQRGTDVVACYFLNRRAIYASTLAQPSLKEDQPSMRFDDVPLPVPRVVFNTFCASDDPWQIGRLVDQILCCGCSRLSSLREFDELMEAGDRVRHLEDELNAGEDIDDDFLNTLRDVSERTSYRIVRSQHYWRQFKGLLKDLRIERIEGWQPYDAFVHRRIGGSIDLINGIAQRHALLQSQADLVYQRKQADRLLKLQTFAELVAIIPLIYYLSHVLEGLCEGSGLGTRSIFLLGACGICLLIVARKLYELGERLREHRATPRETREREVIQKPGLDEEKSRNGVTYICECRG